MGVRPGLPGRSDVGYVRRHAGQDAVFERLRNAGHMLGRPLSKNLGGGLYELRFTCEGVAQRTSYTLEPERQVITLTTFRKQKQNERAEILRARRRLQQRKD